MFRQTVRGGRVIRHVCRCPIFKLHCYFCHCSQRPCCEGEQLEREKKKEESQRGKAREKTEVGLKHVLTSIIGMSAVLCIQREKQFFLSLAGNVKVYRKSLL